MCGPYHPAMKNFSVYDEFARVRNGGAVDRGFTDRWLQQFTAPEYQPYLKTYRDHVNWSLDFFRDGVWQQHPERGNTAYVFAFTNARGATWTDETRTFLDEWSTIDIADPHWPGQERFLREGDGRYALATFGNQIIAPHETDGISYAVDPVPSNQDMVLYYVRRMLETFTDGIYRDDYFSVANYNPLGPGYVGDDGTPHPGVNIFGFHDLSKRIAVMQHQMGRRPLILTHMTNTNVVPMLSFSTLILDHEWRDGGDYATQDAQERLHLDEDTALLLAQSTGLQSGCLSICCPLFHGERLVRSIWGVSLTHEMRYQWPYDALAGNISRYLCDFGYGWTNCRVWRYWDEAVPIKTSGTPVKLLILARKDKAMVIVTSYGSGGEVTLAVDRASLGLVNNPVAVNVESGEKLHPIAPGRFTLNLPRHDFRIIRIE